MYCDPPIVRSCRESWDARFCGHSSLIAYYNQHWTIFLTRPIHTFPVTAQVSYALKMTKIGWIFQYGAKSLKESCMMTKMVISRVAEFKIMIPKISAIDGILTSAKKLLILMVVSMSKALYNISNCQIILFVSTGLPVYCNRWQKSVTADAVEALTVFGQLSPRNHLTRRDVNLSISFIREAAAYAFFRRFAERVAVRIVTGRVLQNVLVLEYDVWLLSFPRRL